jgi:hypothetical protein
MAVESEHVRADMVEATTFPDLARRHGVRGVPRTVLNENLAYVGALPEEAGVLFVQKAGGSLPEEEEEGFERIRAQVSG